MGSQPCWVLGVPPGVAQPPLGTLPACPHHPEAPSSFRNSGILCPNPAQTHTRSHGIQGWVRSGDGRRERGKAAPTASRHPLEWRREELRSQGRFSLPIQPLRVASAPGQGTFPSGSGFPPRTRSGMSPDASAAPCLHHHSQSAGVPGPNPCGISPWGTGWTGNRFLFILRHISGCPGGCPCFIPHHDRGHVLPAQGKAPK